MVVVANHPKARLWLDGLASRPPAPRNARYSAPSPVSSTHPTPPNLDSEDSIFVQINRTPFVPPARLLNTCNLLRHLIDAIAQDTDDCEITAHAPSIGGIE
ncbi:hypothetical protein B0H14DRAFT_3466068 [Mycena olivaceomarginata]|nr:hypothetical protein B0H14DRAFT_3466068 [Mycena olivaceomarginata]